MFGNVNGPLVSLNGKWVCWWVGRTGTGRFTQTMGWGKMGNGGLWQQVPVGGGGGVGVGVWRLGLPRPAHHLPDACHRQWVRRYSTLAALCHFNNIVNRHHSGRPGQLAHRHWAPAARLANNVNTNTHRGTSTAYRLNCISYVNTAHRILVAIIIVRVLEQIRQNYTAWYRREYAHVSQCIIRQVIGDNVGICIAVGGPP